MIPTNTFSLPRILSTPVAPAASNAITPKENPGDHQRMPPELTKLLSEFFSIAELANFEQSLEKLEDSKFFVCFDRMISYLQNKSNELSTKKKLLIQELFFCRMVEVIRNIDHNDLIKIQVQINKLKTIDLKEDIFEVSYLTIYNYFHDKPIFQNKKFKDFIAELKDDFKDLDDCANLLTDIQNTFLKNKDFTPTRVSLERFWLEQTLDESFKYLKLLSKYYLDNVFLSYCNPVYYSDPDCYNDEEYDDPHQILFDILPIAKRFIEKHEFPSNYFYICFPAIRNIDYLKLTFDEPLSLLPSLGETLLLNEHKFTPKSEVTEKQWGEYFAEFQKISRPVTIDLTEADDFVLNHLTPLMECKAAVSIHLNASILRNPVNHNFTLKRFQNIQFVWHVNEILDPNQATIINNKSPVHLEVTLRLGNTTLDKVLTHLNLEKLYLLYKDHSGLPLRIDGLNLPSADLCKNLKTIVFKFDALKTLGLRKSVKSFIDKGIQVECSYKQSFHFDPYTSADEREEDLFNSLTLLEYFLKNSPNSILVDTLPVLKDSDHSLMSKFPSATLVSMSQSACNWNSPPALDLLASLEQVFISFENKEIIKCKQPTPQFSFQEFFLKAPKLAQHLWKNTAKSLFLSNKFKNSSPTLTEEIFVKLLETFEFLENPYEFELYQYYIIILKTYLKETSKDNLSSKFTMNLVSQLENIYIDVFKQKQLTPLLSIVTTISPPFITDGCVKFLSQILLNGLPNILPELIHQTPPITGLEKLLKLFENEIIWNKYFQLGKGLIEKVPLDELESEDACRLLTLMATHKILDSQRIEAIKTLFLKNEKQLNLSTRLWFSEITLSAPCSIEFFSLAFKTFVHHYQMNSKEASAKFGTNFLTIHLSNLLEFMSQQEPTSWILEKLDQQKMHIPLLNQSVLTLPFTTAILTLVPNHPNFDATAIEQYLTIYEGILKRKVQLPKIPTNFPLFVKKKILDLFDSSGSLPKDACGLVVTTAFQLEEFEKCLTTIKRFYPYLSFQTWTELSKDASLRRKILEFFMENRDYKIHLNIITIFGSSLEQETDVDENEKLFLIQLLAQTTFSDQDLSKVTFSIQFLKSLLEIALKKNLVDSQTEVIKNLLKISILSANKDPEIENLFFDGLAKLHAIAKDKTKSKRLRTTYSEIRDQLFATMQSLHKNSNVQNLSVSFSQRLIKDYHYQLYKFATLAEANIINLFRQKESSPILENPDFIEVLVDLICETIIRHGETSNLAIPDNIVVPNTKLAKKILEKFIKDPIYNVKAFSILYECLAHPLPQQQQEFFGRALSDPAIKNLCFSRITPSNFSINPLFCTILLEGFKNNYTRFLDTGKFYAFQWIGFTYRSNLTEENKAQVMDLIKLLKPQELNDFIILFPCRLNGEETSKIAESLKSEIIHLSVNSLLTHRGLLNEKNRVNFYLSRYKLASHDVIKTISQQISEIEIVLPAGGENLNIKQLMEYFKKIDPEVVYTYASPELIKKAKDAKTTHQILLGYLENLINILTKNTSISLAPTDSHERKKFYGVIIHDLQAGLFHMNAKVEELKDSLGETIRFFNEMARVLVPLAEAGEPDTCIAPYQNAARCIYRAVAPDQTDKPVIDTIEEKIKRRVLNYLWSCIKRVIKEDPLYINTHYYDAYIAFFARFYGNEMGSTKIVHNDPLLNKTLAEIEAKKTLIFKSFHQKFNLTTNFNHICEDYAKKDSDSYGLEDLNDWAKFNKIPLDQCWSDNQKATLPWLGLLKVLIKTGIFNLRF